MGMNVNPKDLIAKVDSTKVVIKGVPVEQNDSVWLKTKAKAKKSGNTKTPEKPKEQKMGFAKGLARTALNAIGNYLLPQGAPGIGDMLLSTEKEELEDIYNRAMNGGRLTPEEQKIFNEHFMRS